MEYQEKYYVINKISNDPDPYNNLEVNGFTTGKIANKVFCFTCDKIPVKIGLKKSNEFYNYPHHLDSDDLSEICEMFPNIIPPRERTVSTKLNVWGELAREALSNLIIDGKLFIDHREPSGKVIRRKLYWAAESPYIPNSKIMKDYVDLDGIEY